MSVTKLISPLSSRIASVRTTKTAIPHIAAIATIAILPGVASAQTIYSGQGQALNTAVRVLGGTVDATISSSVAGPLNAATGGSYTVGPEVRSNSLLLVDIPAVSLDTTLDVNASALSASTNGASAFVTSTAAVGNVAAPGSTNNFTLGVSVGGLSLTNLPLLSLKAIETVTTASANGVRTSTTTIKGLTIYNGLTGVLSAPLTVGATTYSNVDLVFTDTDPGLNLNIPGIATVALHEKINGTDPLKTRTTNGIHVSLLSGGGVGQLHQRQCHRGKLVGGCCSGAGFAGSTWSGRCRSGHRGACGAPSPPPDQGVITVRSDARIVRTVTIAHG